MANTVLEFDLGPANTGQAANLQYRILEDDGTTQHTSWTGTDIVEVDATDMPGYYRVNNKVDVPEGGGFVEVQNSVGTVLLASGVIEPNILTDTTYSELTGVPAATTSIRNMISWIFMLARNKRLQTNSLQTVRDDGDSTDIATSATSDDGSTVTRSEWT